MKTSTSIQSNNRTIEQSNNFHRGSALLIVLGMLSFMVISAVAFSAYMRAARLPSSFLRQTSASRLLAKAAIAEAVDEIDAAIGNMPHPGIWNNPQKLTEDVNQYYFPRNSGTKLNRNIWKDRIYIGNKGNGEEMIDRHLVEPFAPIDDEVEVSELTEKGTVSTLCLEALAYIPAPLVNSARYYSRRSNAAKWHPMAFDAGRFAFCAIDVSDYFDVNSLAANCGRSSASSGRITLAHIFEDSARDENTFAHTKYVSQPSEWEQFMKQFRDESAAAAVARGKTPSASKTKVPLVSLADLNLALYNYGSFQNFSPFAKYVDQNLGSFYSGYDQLGIMGNVDLRQLTFVTDSWFPPQTHVASTQKGGKIGIDPLDLCDEQNRLFSVGDMQRDGMTLNTIFNLNSVGLDRLFPNTPKPDEAGLNKIDKVMLYDYLDMNSVPVSLAIPEVERTPMIAAFEHSFKQGSLALKTKTLPDNAESILLSDTYPGEYGGSVGQDVMERTVTYVKEYRLDQSELSQIVMGMKVSAIVAYPFHRGMDVKEVANFTYDGFAELFFTVGKFNFRTENGDDILHVKADGNKIGLANPSDSVFAIPLTSSGANFNMVNPQSEDQVMKKVEFMADPSAAQQIAQALGDRAILTVTWQQKQTASVSEDALGVKTKTWSNVGTPQRDTAQTFIQPVNLDGVPDDNFDKKNLKAWLDEGKQVTLRTAIWLRVKDQDQNTVDLVPACIEDDKEFIRGAPNNSDGPQGGKQFGRLYPFMTFAGPTFNFSDKGFDNGFTPVPIEFTPKAVMCPDPRWNWAPEHWYVKDNVGSDNGQIWLQELRDNWLGKDGRDNDIFMATSDVGYLQSIYELAFLPRLSNMLTCKGGDRYGELVEPLNREAIWMTDAAALKASNGNANNASLMWRTYCPYGRMGADSKQHPRDPFNSLGFVSRGSGCKVNPYSDDTNVVMAVFANTPFDWWAAAAEQDSTDVGVSAVERVDNAVTFNKTYAFNNLSGNSNAKFAWKDLRRVARNFMVSLRSELESNIHETDQDKDVDGYRSELEDAYLNDSAKWELAYDWLDWSGTLGSSGYAGRDDYFGTPRQSGENNDKYDKMPLDGNTDQLWDVDRKFLYGYWRDCFSVQQQLFLVFVKAEPMMMGGGAVGLTPPALGARAMALVWRDPNPTIEDCGLGNSPRPHRTRVLFYRQFD